MNFIPVSTYQTSKIWLFTYHMCAYLVQITVVKCDAQPSNDVNHLNMFYAVVIMLRGQLQDFLIKSNQNTMVEIYQCLQRLLHWNILVNLTRADIKSSTISRQRHVVFHYFLSDYIKQDAATTTTNSKRLISLLKDKKILTTSLSKIWENTDGCDEQ